MKLRVFDNNGETFDRYTVLIDNEVEKHIECLLLSHNCDSPQGVSMFDSYHYNHLSHGHRGEEIPFSEIPLNVQNHVKGQYFFNQYPELFQGS